MSLQRTLLRAHHVMTVTPYAHPEAIPFMPGEPLTAERALELTVAWLEVLSVVLRSHATDHAWEQTELCVQHPARGVGA